MLEKNERWSFVARENARNVLTSKWVFKVKHEIHLNRTVTGKTKARLVVEGFQRVQGVDVTRTYAPVVKFAFVRAVSALFDRLDLDQHQMEVVTALQNGDLNEAFFMKIPTSVTCDMSEELVCKLNKVLNGFKWALGHWYPKVGEILVDQLGFKKRLGDPCSV